MKKPRLSLLVIVAGVFALSVSVGAQLTKSASPAQEQEPSRTLKVFIAGNVVRPGTYSVEAGCSWLTLLARAGGLRNDAPSAQLSFFRRHTGFSTTVATIQLDDLKRGLQRIPLLQDGDSVIVSNRAGHAASLVETLSGERLYRLMPSAGAITVSGQVGRSGLVMLPQQGTLLLRQAIALAGGLALAPSDSRIVMTRRVNGLNTVMVEINGAPDFTDERWNTPLQKDDTVSVSLTSRPSPRQAAPRAYLWWLGSR